jgi:hypothetical protein
MRIACWSGPRNLSTAMMYSFANRPDFTVLDEPFYAAYLAKTGADHPMRAEIMAAHDCDDRSVAATCAQDGTPHVYQKHMCHHVLPDTPLDWATTCSHVFLIRHPARVLASYTAKREDVTLDDIGVTQQTALFERFGGIVIDSHDVRADPAGMMRALCAKLDLPYDAAMLHWPAGGCAADGVWARHWYPAVHRSTGFAGAEGALPELTGSLADIAQAAMPAYCALQTHRLRPLQ